MDSNSRRFQIDNGCYILDIKMQQITGRQSQTDVDWILQHFTQFTRQMEAENWGRQRQTTNQLHQQIAGRLLQNSMRVVPYVSILLLQKTKLTQQNLWLQQQIQKKQIIIQKLNQLVTSLQQQFPFPPEFQQIQRQRMQAQAQIKKSIQQYQKNIQRIKALEGQLQGFLKIIDKYQGSLSRVGDIASNLVDNMNLHNDWRSIRQQGNAFNHVMVPTQTTIRRDCQALGTSGKKHIDKQFQITKALLKLVAEIDGKRRDIQLCNNCSIEQFIKFLADRIKQTQKQINTYRL